MGWQEVRRAYPHQWLLVQALEARSEHERRIVEQMSVVDAFPDSPSAMRRYMVLHRRSPEREFYVLHTDREAPDIHERIYVGPRMRL